MYPKTMAVDLAKNSFQIHVGDQNGKVLKRTKMSRSGFALFLQKSLKSRIFMEACGSSNYWARKAQSFGHEVKLIAPQYVKPFVKRQKNDSADAEAIFEAGCRKNMNFVPVKSVAQQDIQSLIRIRDMHVGQRTALSNQIRGLLHEYGISIAQGHGNLKRTLIALINSETPDSYLEDLTPFTIALMRDLSEKLQNLEDSVKKYDSQIEELTKSSETCKKLLKIPGIGPLTAASLVAAIGHASEFSNSRQLSAWLGLVPRQNSTGGRTKLLGISKQGNKYLRTLMIHGGRAVLINTGRKKDPRSLWAEQLKQKVGTNKAAVAMANKNARTVWAILRKGGEYDPLYENKKKKIKNLNKSDKVSQIPDAA